MMAGTRGSGFRGRFFVGVLLVLGPLWVGCVGLMSGDMRGFGVEAAVPLGAHGKGAGGGVEYLTNISHQDPQCDWITSHFSDGYRIGYRLTPYDAASISTLHAGVFVEWSYANDPMRAMAALGADLGLALHWVGGGVGFGPALGGGLRFTAYENEQSGRNLRLSLRYLYLPVWAERDFPYPEMHGVVVGISYNAMIW